tara:strand:- start:392 stop:592 length:201 start_codon:yes stop_codon:yes gene_type:complete
MKVREYKPTMAQSARMMLAIEKENERENPSYQHCTFTFGALQHAANEGTHAGHWECLEKLYELYGK